MKFTIDKSEKYTVLELQEEKLDSLKAPHLKSEFVTLYQSGTKNLILNLMHVKYVDSSGLSAILIANRLLTEGGGHLVLVSVNDHVLKLLKISKLDAVFTI
ncbi:MAG: STAS domain-containing protein, partial [Flammeovirgaceae bacterium]|nr:STAS domain-containing protein [Flammeovirgaceae bacterium]